MNRRGKYLLRNLGILTVSNFASKILSVLLVPLYTSVLSTTEYGRYDIVVSTVSLLYPVLTVNMADAVMRFTMEKNEVSNASPALIGIKYMISSICIFGFGLWAGRLCGLFPGMAGLEMYVFLYYLSYVLNQYFIQLAKGLERVPDMGVAGCLSTAVMLGSNLLFLLVWKRGLTGFFLAGILSHSAAAVYLLARLTTYFGRQRRIQRKNRNLERQMLSYGGPLIFTTLSWWVNSTADKYTVTFLCGVAANGILAMAYKIPGMMNTLQNIFIQAWQISGISEYGKKDTFIWLNAIMCLACAILIFAVRPVAALLFTGEFYEAWKYTPLLLVTSVLNASAGFMGPMLSARKATKILAASGIWGAVVNVVMNVVLVLLIGIQGAAAATLMSSFMIFEVRRKAAGQFLGRETGRAVFVSWGLLTVQGLMSILQWPMSLQLVLMIIQGVLYGNTCFRNVKAEHVNIEKTVKTKERSDIDEHQDRNSKSDSGGWYIETRSGHRMAA